MKFIILTIFYLVLSLSTVYSNSAHQESAEQKYFQNGVMYYIKRYYNRAAKNFLKALEINTNNTRAKLYMKKAYNKYYKSATLFFEGINYFSSGDYNNAEKKFKKALFINPLNRRAAYYLKLCYTPGIIIKPNYKIFRTSLNDNKFLIKIDTHRTIPNWVEKWEFRIEDMENKIIRKIKGEKIPPGIIRWNLKNDNGEIYSANKIKYYLILTSIYGRVIKSKLKSISIVHDKEAIKKRLSLQKGNKVIKFTMASGVLFAYNSDVLKSDAKEMLIPLIKFLKNNLKYKIKIMGYTDNIGSRKFNINLSRRRALSVKIFLVKNGIDKNRIKIFGFGEKTPIASNKTKEDRSRNRRVEFKLYLQD